MINYAKPPEILYHKINFNTRLYFPEKEAYTVKGNLGGFSPKA